MSEDPTGLDFAGRGRRLATEQAAARKKIDTGLDFATRGKVVTAREQKRARVTAPASSLDFVAFGREQAKNISNMVEKSTGVPMVQSVTTTGRKKKRAVVKQRQESRKKAKASGSLVEQIRGALKKRRGEAKPMIMEAKATVTKKTTRALKQEPPSRAPFGNGVRAEERALKKRLEEIDVGIRERPRATPVQGIFARIRGRLRR